MYMPARGRSVFVALCLALASSVSVFAADKPNIVYLIADDLGNKDTGFQGGQISTPNLDKLAATGVTLKNFYVQPFSSQTRAALLTGRYPMRYGLQTMSILPSSKFGLPVEERTLAQGLREAGYRTAFIGSGNSATPGRTFGRRTAASTISTARYRTKCMTAWEKTVAETGAATKSR